MSTSLKNSIILKPMNEDTQPIGARCLIDVIEADKVSQSGLELANSNSLQLPVRGKVIRSGDASLFKEGEVLLFRRYAVDELKFNIEGNEVIVYIVDDADVIAKVTPKVVTQ